MYQSLTVSFTSTRLAQFSNDLQGWLESYRNLTRQHSTNIHTLYCIIYPVQLFERTRERLISLNSDK